jgi:hypothetical protein
VSEGEQVGSGDDKEGEGGKEEGFEGVEGYTLSGHVGAGLAFLPRDGGSAIWAVVANELGRVGHGQ